MNDIFIEKIIINKVRHLENLEIPISQTERKHLIFTGKNGSGKTSVLESVRLSLNRIRENDNKAINIIFKENELVRPTYHKGELIFAFFDAKRKANFERPKGIEKVDFNQVSVIYHTYNTNFIKYLVDLKAQRSFARDEGKDEVVQHIDNWFSNFEELLKSIFNDSNLILEFDYENYNFNIIQSNKEKFDFNTLSDGYSSILNIVSELIMRMEKMSSKVYDLQGVVLIDEIESHLHIDLQKQILPFLTKVFPKVQFIVTTHSPFVLNSISNAVIYDLENKILVKDLSGYSVESIIEGYFDSDKYSTILKKEVEEYELLWNKTDLTEVELDKLKQLHHYFKNLPKFGAEELEMKIKEIELSKIRKL